MFVINAKILTMKQIIIIQLLSFIVLPFYSQQVDQRLLVKFSEAELIEMMTEDKEQYQFYLNCLDYGHYLSNYVTKEKTVEKIGELDLSCSDDINFFSLNIEPVPNQYLYFKLKDCEKMLVIRSVEHIKMGDSKKK